MKAGELKTNRVEMFGKLLALAEQNKHITSINNLYEGA
jgi:hypothetical protein